MTRTRSTTLIALLIAGAAVGWFVENALLMSGRALLIPPLTLGATLLIVGIVLLALARPIRRSTLGRTPGRVDPFRATRVVLLAKASALAGALLTGITGECWPSCWPGRCCPARPPWGSRWPVRWEPSSSSSPGWSPSTGARSRPTTGTTRAPGIRRASS